ncbi:ABC transporter permease [Rhodobacteraceae bacterium HSP-20]|uniref:ABC transporter permease n=1 Tax=Paragemmobacter amnigenus TaxID=2852097 RepID=A0ABS6J590_9RHOB|nr:ABC transporter permease [Rhodobacter amnigenus]MBU9698657.1 ABC transporter permease [Rhodobacter amnigenus]MBV4389884.1 ABC transporter permease [Rhodobacter amnigenus]
MSCADETSLGARRGIGRALLADPMGLAGLVIVVLFLSMAVFAPWIAPYDPIALDVKAKFQTPSAAHWAGTDHLGRDLLSRIIWGARLALGIAITSVGIAGGLGLILGLVAGYGPRWLDGLLVLVFDSMSSLPMIFFALAVITVLGPGTATLILVIVLVSFPAYARLIRTQTLALAGADFILAERVMGAGTARILLRHLLPNVTGPLVILLCMDIPVVIMLEAGLSYLNLGVKPPAPSWGNMLSEGYNALRQAPHVVVVAGIPLVLATLGFTFLGEGLRDVLDPRGAGRRWG